VKVVTVRIKDLCLGVFTLSIYIYIYIASASRSETPGKFRNVVLEKDGKDQLDQSCEK
jgi:hypothetical protein